MAVGKARKSARRNSRAPGGNTVVVEFTDGIAWVAMNRPEKRNAMKQFLDEKSFRPGLGAYRRAR